MHWSAFTIVELTLATDDDLGVLPAEYGKFLPAVEKHWLVDRKFTSKYFAKTALFHKDFDMIFYVVDSKLFASCELVLERDGLWHFNDLRLYLLICFYHFCN